MHPLLPRFAPPIFSLLHPGNSLYLHPLILRFAPPITQIRHPGLLSHDCPLSDPFRKESLAGGLRDWRHDDAKLVIRAEVIGGGAHSLFWRSPEPPKNTELVIEHLLGCDYGMFGQAGLLGQILQRELESLLTTNVLDEVPWSPGDPIRRNRLAPAPRKRA